MVNIFLTENELKAFRFIRNQLAHSGTPPSIRDIMKRLGYASPRAASYIVEKLEAKGFIARHHRGKIQVLRDIPESDTHAQTVNIPLVGSAPCGVPVFAEENIEATIPVSIRIARPPARYFLLRAMGDSMNKKGIQDGNLVLVRQQSTADNGDCVVAQINGEVTIKEFHRARNAVILKPRSSNKQHQPIILTEDFQVLGVIRAVIDFEGS